MKVKEAERTANVAWSPAPLPRLMLAAGTAAQQLDATFSSSAKLEVFGLALDDSALQMPVIASVETPARFHCVSWGGHGLGGARPAGVIVGGADGGQIGLYDAQQLLDGQPALLETSSRHTGAVRALDFNPFQANLLASGAADSELYIWDLNSPSTPMTPGAKAQPPEDVSAVSWNRQVQHIMASTFASRCVVWDLRKNEPIIKVGEGQAGMKCKVLAWHPEVATQLVLASEDDHTPAIQLWDLRFATSPLKTLQRHQKGILSLAWCQRDSHLLLSAGKDDKILCWDPHSDAPGGEVVAELSASPQWNFSVNWCPRNPALIAGCSFDGHVSVYNVMGTVEEPPTSPTSTLADSFPDMAGVAAALPAVQRRTSVPLTRPPGWMKRPCGATFGFGGRLVSFCHTPTTDGGRPTRHVEIHQVVTEPELVQRSEAFQQVLLTDGLPGFCAERAGSASKPDRPVWRFLAARFSPEPRTELLRLLGYQSQPAAADDEGVEDQAMQEPPPADAAASGEDAFEAISRSQTTSSESPTAEPEELFDIPAGDDTDGLVSQAILRGDMSEAVERCIQADRTADALIIAMATSQQLYENTRAKYLESMKTDLSRLISALVSHDWSAVVSRCDPGSWREALVAVLTHAPPQQVAPLCEALGARLELQHTEAMWTSALLCYVCAGSVDRLVQCWERTRPDSASPHAIQDLMEQAMTLYRANQLSGTATPLTSGGMQQKLLRYAQLLTSQGSLETALGYLGDCVDPAAVSLCERVQHCLAPAAAARQRQAAPAARFPAAASAAHHGYQPQPAGQPSPGLPAARDGRLAQPQPQPAVFQPPVAPVAPLAPASAPQPAAAPPAGGGGAGYRLGGRRQYAADPSLAGPGAAGYGVSGGYASSAPYGQMAAPVGQPSSTPYGQMAAPIGQPSSTPYGQMAAPVGQPSSSYGQMAAPSAAATVFTPSFSEPQPFAPVSQPAVQPFAPAPTGAEYAAPPGPPMGTAVSSGPGWNDPPPLRRSSKKASTSTTSVLQTVTQAIYNPAEMAAVQPPANSPHYPMAGVYQPAPSGQFSPYQPVAAVQQPAQPAAAPTPPPPAPQEPPPPKGPVPPEHAPLQDTLERLRAACAASASTAQARRRLEEVSRRLELLYDLLRASSLSPGTLQGLHQLIGWLQCSDWASAQQQLNALVAASNMAEIAGFMPGIKSLLQIAAQMQVQI